jgi:hypothetical protein
LTYEEAKAASEGACQAAGCHTPGGKPFACDCGHTTSYQKPNWSRGFGPMNRTYSFKFLNDRLNLRLIGLMKKANIDYVIDRNGAIRYSRHDEEIVGNELIRTIRNEVFSAWQVLSCPKDWTERYKEYMTKKRVEFAEELINDQLCFLLPRKYRPHSWKL